MEYVLNHPERDAQLGWYQLTKDHVPVVAWLEGDPQEVIPGLESVDDSFRYWEAQMDD
jgi:hypothetical protein